MATVRLGDIAREVKQAFKGERKGVPVVGLEHIVPGEVVLHNYMMDDSSTLNRAFTKGQVLFGRRRAYQKKTAYATFDGICSGDIIVAEPFEGKVIRVLLPFIMSSDQFYQYAVQQSKGSLSPRVSWKDLANYEFSLPPLSEQRVLADKLWAAYRLKESYKKLIDATKDIVKAKFVEMFGETEKTRPLKDCIDVSFPGEWGGDDTEGNGIKVIRTTNFTNDGTLNLSNVVTRCIDEKKIQKKKLIKGDIILERSGGTAENPVGRVVYFDEDGDYLFNNFTQMLRPKAELNSKFVFYSLFAYYQINKEAIRSMGNKTTGIQNLKMDQYWQIPIADVPLEMQIQFADILDQSSRSLSSLRRAITSVNNVMKSLINN